MDQDHRFDNSRQTTLALAEAMQRARQRREGDQDPLQADAHFKRIYLDRLTIQLTEVEFRIICLLASRPYRAYTVREIIRGASTDECPVDESTLDDHIASLRDKLGFFHDYIQTVPYVGYRFKE